VAAKADGPRSSVARRTDRVPASTAHPTPTIEAKSTFEVRTVERRNRRIAVAPSHATRGPPGSSRRSTAQSSTTDRNRFDVSVSTVAT